LHHESQKNVEMMLQCLQGRFKYVNLKQLLGNVQNDCRVQIAGVNSVSVIGLWV